MERIKRERDIMKNKNGKTVIAKDTPLEDIWKKVYRECKKLTWEYVFGIDKIIEKKNKTHARNYIMRNMDLRNQ